MKKIVSVLMLVSMLFMLSSCAALIGAGAGAIAGAKLDRRNPIRGMIVGTGIGFVAGAFAARTMEEARRRAAAKGDTTDYRFGDGRRVYQAKPIDYHPGRACNKIEGLTWENGKLIDRKEETVCF